uniref:NADH-ubiquinone oxidoreductase chain 2 n=1 Tax=Idgia oculata TaxID=1404354 RepID=A0A5J6CGH7_9CUCU|nr:NADH dehydrogenase subunit 2 [Idgia oculata]QEQ14400.1 NADH dehydrogenase subunit 2 [Idgia oculata]
MKFYKLVFFNTLIMGTLISISSSSWLGMWMGLEINLISMIPLLTNKNSYSSEAAIKYFITQALASMIILMIIIMVSLYFSLNILYIKSYLMILNSALLTKMGAAPFHFWFPEVMEGLNWMSSLLMLTWQKIAPMILLMYNSQINNYFMIIIILSMLISGILGFNQISLRKILAYSSINHIGWMLPAILLSWSIWLIYFSIYFLITLNILIFFNYFNIFYIKQLIPIINFNFTLKIFFLSNFLSLGGLPPFLGFLPKWFLINELVKNNFYFLSMLMILLTLLTLFYYIRITLSALMLNFNNKIYFNNIINKLLILINFLNLMSLPMLILSLNAF